jgi:antitoxin HicB
MTGRKCLGAGEGRAAMKRVLARQIAQEMANQRLSKSEMAKRMQTSRAALDRLLDPESHAVRLNTLFQSGNGSRSPD